MKIGNNYLAILGVTTVTTVMSCSPTKKEYTSFELYPVRMGSLTEMEYTPLATKFFLWSPTAEEVRLMLYDAGIFRGIPSDLPTLTEPVCMSISIRDRGIIHTGAH